MFSDRSPSQATLDSLDTARYSEDGGGDRGGSGGDVAVLEFELRKAKETIHALRANLTQFAGKLFCKVYQTVTNLEILVHRQTNPLMESLSVNLLQQNLLIHSSNK